jgi:hypothetical protein
VSGHVKRVRSGFPGSRLPQGVRPHSELEIPTLMIREAARAEAPVRGENGTEASGHLTRTRPGLFRDPRVGTRRGRSRGLFIVSSDGHNGRTMYSMGISKRAMMPPLSWVHPARRALGPRPRQQPAVLPRPFARHLQPRRCERASHLAALVAEGSNSTTPRCSGERSRASVSRHPPSSRRSASCPRDPPR